MTEVRTCGELHLDFPAEVSLRQRITVHSVGDLRRGGPVDRSQNGDERLQVTSWKSHHATSS